MTPLDNIRLLALDVDGTLAAREDEVTPRTRAALHQATAAGIEVVIATGRRYRTTRVVIEALGLPVRAVVLGGALVKAGDGSTLHEARFEDGDFQELRDLLVEAGQSPVCQRDSSTRGGPDFIVDTGSPWNASTERYFEIHNAFGASENLSGGHEPEGTIAIGAFGEEDDLRRVRALIAERYGDHFQTSAVPVRRRQDWYFELLPSGVSKWSALSALAAREGLSSAAICAVGDEANDLPMIRGAGVGVAMGNAREEVKSAADFTTGACDEDGIVDVVERLLASR